MPILVVFIFLVFLFIRIIKTNNKSFTTASYFVLIYLISVGCGLVLYFFGLRVPVFSISEFAMFYFILAFYISIWPLLMYKENNISYLKISSASIYKCVESVLIITSLFSIVFYIPHMFNSLSGNLNENRMNIGETVSGQASFGLINSFAALAASLYPVLLLMFFISITIRKRFSIKSVLLLISSFSYVILVLTFVGRDGMVFWAMTFVFYFVFFKRFMTSAIKKKLRRICWIICIVFLIPFAIITAARFGSQPGRFGTAVLDYMGQSIINFSDNFQINITHHSNGYKSFPLFVNWFKHDNPTQILQQVNREETDVLDQGVHYWTFGTYIKTFMYDFGSIGTLFLLMFISLIEWKSLYKANKKRVFNVSNILLYVLIFQMIGQGVFYFRLYTPGFNFYIVVIFFLSGIFSFRKGKSLYIKAIDNNIKNSMLKN